MELLAIFKRGKENLPLLVLILFTLLGCSRNIPVPMERLHVAEDIAKQNSLHVKSFKTKNFDIYAHYNSITCKDINVYIEGDGLAWITRSRVSDNPTPLNPLALKLMVQDNSSCKLYLARPCQYIKSSTCKQKYWTNHRFSQEVLDGYHEIFDSFKNRSFTLYGYSGGGAIATILAAQRTDVKKLVTIAGNLDIELWAKKHYLTPLNGSLNPADFTSKLLHVKQLHLIGEKDTIIDKSIFESYLSKFDDTTFIKSKIIKDFTHHCCWEKKWKNLLKKTSKNN